MAIEIERVIRFVKDLRWDLGNGNLENDPYKYINIMLGKNHFG